MSPVLGQGVNFAMLDAATLQTCLQNALHSSPTSTATAVKQALINYSIERKHALRYYQLASWWLNHWFQNSNIPGMAFTRDTFFVPFSRVYKPLRRQMILSLAGAKSGFMPVFTLDRKIPWEFWKY